MSRSYIVLYERVCNGRFSDTHYEEVGLVEAPNPRRAMREALRIHGNYIAPPMSELVVIPASAVRVVKTDVLV